MNRLKMKEEIAWRVPMLARRDKAEWNEAERRRIEFVSDYPISRIPKLTLDEYAIGKGATNRSFCYRLEREMDTLGKIVGATAFKFGVYFGRTRSDAEDRYRFASHWGSTLEEAFITVKDSIVTLLQAADDDDPAAIAENPLSPMFKGKILFVYHPDHFAPIYSGEHLDHFISELDIDGRFRCGADMQRALMDYRATWPALTAHPAALYMRLLYDVCGHPPGKEVPDSGGGPRKPILAEAVAGAAFITQMPPLPPATATPSDKAGKPDYEAWQRTFKRIGDRGEAIVKEMEKQRLMSVGRPDLAAKIDHVAERDDRAGFDILSFEEDGRERPIEVKATAAPNLAGGFYVTANELEKATDLPNYHVVFVFEAMSKRPKVLPLLKPNFAKLGFQLCPLNYHARVNPRNA